MNSDANLLVISGSMGSGKTTVQSEASDLLVRAEVPHAAIDLDWLSVMHPSPAGGGDRLMLQNLAAIWPIYAEGGAERLIVATVVGHRSDLEGLRSAIPGAVPKVCLLKSPRSTRLRRLRIREPGLFQREAMRKTTELDEVLGRAGVEDFSVDNDDGRSVTEVAREVLHRVGWLESS